jgi:hypothetical protein
VPWLILGVRMIKEAASLTCAHLLYDAWRWSAADRSTDHFTNPLHHHQQSTFLYKRACVFIQISYVTNNATMPLMHALEIYILRVISFEVNAKAL